MPIKPQPHEDKSDFIARCIETEVRTYGKDMPVATAICYSYWDKQEMSKLRTSQERFTAKLNYTKDFRGINLLADSLEDACWDGYIAIGTKMLDGREVPNCVPVDEMETQPTIDSTYPGEPISGSK